MDRDLIKLMCCDGKVAFRFYTDAAFVVTRGRRSGNDAVVRRQVYKCPSCGMFHVGQRPEAQKAKRQLRYALLARSVEYDEDEPC